MLRFFILPAIAMIALFGAEVEWSHSYADAVTEAKAEEKNILVIITTESCRWCRRLESTTLQDEAVVKRINENFASVHVTRDVDEYPSHLTAKYVPMSYFVRPDGSVIHDMVGYWNVEDYLSILDDVQYELKKEEK